MSSAEESDCGSDVARSELDEDVEQPTEKLSDAVLQTALDSAIAVRPSLREALEPVHRVPANAVEGELRKALGHYQMKLDFVVKILKDVVIENQVMKTANQRKRGKGNGTAIAPIQVEAHRDTIKAAAQKYLYLYNPFPTLAIFGRITSSRCPKVDIFDPRRARDESLNLQAEVAEIFNSFPPNHPVLQYLNAKTAPKVGKMFISEVSTERSHFVKRVLENLPSIAPSEGYPTIYNYRNRALVKEDPVAQHLRGTNDDNFPPFAFPPGVSTEDASLAYTGDIFPLLIRMGLYGPSSLTSLSHSDTRAKGQDFALQDFTPGMFALSVTVLRYALSGESGFSRDSKTIPHPAYFNRLKLQVFMASWDGPAMLVRRARATSIVLGTDGVEPGDSPTETDGLDTAQRNAALAAGFAGTIPTATRSAPAPAPAQVPSPAPMVTAVQDSLPSSPSNSQPLTYLDAPSSRSSRSAIASSSASRRRAPSPISAGLPLPETLHATEELQEHVASLTLRDEPDEDANEPEQAPQAPAKRTRGRQAAKVTGVVPEATEKPKTRKTGRARK